MFRDDTWNNIFALLTRHVHYNDRLEIGSPGYRLQITRLPRYDDKAFDYWEQVNRHLHRLDKLCAGLLPEHHQHAFTEDRPELVVAFSLDVALESAPQILGAVIDQKVEPNVINDANVD